VTTTDRDQAPDISPDVKAAMRDFILDTFIVADDQRDFADDDSFMDRHLVDSTGFLEIIMFVEDTWGITVEDDEVIPENLDSLSGLDRFVRRKVTQ
jgi:acyl carrier protein